MIFYWEGGVIGNPMPEAQQKQKRRHLNARPPRDKAEAGTCLAVKSRTFTTHFGLLCWLCGSPLIF